jgi:hypothetical protein
MAHPGGRPTKYAVEMSEKIVSLMKQGLSKYEIGLELNIGETSFYEYIKIHPEFAKAVKEGEWFSRGAWEKMGRENLQNKDFSYTGWYMNMKNRHGWKDRQENSYDVNVKQEESIKDLE